MGTGWDSLVTIAANSDQMDRSNGARPEATLGYQCGHRLMNLHHKKIIEFIINQTLPPTEYEQVRVSSPRGEGGSMSNAGTQDDSEESLHLI